MGVAESTPDAELECDKVPGALCVAVVDGAAESVVLGVIEGVADNEGAAETLLAAEKEGLRDARLLTLELADDVAHAEPLAAADCSGVAVELRERATLRDPQLEPLLLPVPEERRDAAALTDGLALTEELAVGERDGSEERVAKLSVEEADCVAAGVAVNAPPEGEIVAVAAADVDTEVVLEPDARDDALNEGDADGERDARLDIVALGDNDAAPDADGIDDADGDGVVLNEPVGAALVDGEDDTDALDFKERDDVLDNESAALELTVLEAVQVPTTVCEAAADSDAAVDGENVTAAEPDDTALADATEAVAHTLLVALKVELAVAEEPTDSELDPVGRVEPVNGAVPLAVTVLDDNGAAEREACADTVDSDAVIWALGNAEAEVVRLGDDDDDSDEERVASEGDAADDADEESVANDGVATRDVDAELDDDVEDETVWSSVKDIEAEGLLDTAGDTDADVVTETDADSLGDPELDTISEYAPLGLAEAEGDRDACADRDCDGLPESVRDREEVTDADELVAAVALFRAVAHDDAVVVADVTPEAVVLSVVCELSDGVRDAVPVPDAERELDADPLSVISAVLETHAVGAALWDGREVVLAAVVSDTLEDAEVVAVDDGLVVGVMSALVDGDSVKARERVADDDWETPLLALVVMEGVALALRDADLEIDGLADVDGLADAVFVRAGDAVNDALRCPLVVPETDADNEALAAVESDDLRDAAADADGESEELLDTAAL